MDLEAVYSREGDRFILSKGHAAPALYATLFHKGVIPKRILDGFAVDGGFLPLHNCRHRDHKIDFSAGSLGMGLGVGAGMALALKRDGSARNVYVLMGDGDLNEGSTWEALLFAGRY